MAQAFLVNIILILATAVFIVAIFKKLNLSPVLGYFVAGGLIGEHGFDIVTSEETHFLGEMGVVFLLFAIGLELTLERLKAMRSYVFGFGTLQIVLSGLIIGLCTYIIINGSSAALVISGGLALSSTAIVMQVLAENREQSTQVGRLSLSVLLMQDFAVVPLLVIVPILAGTETHIAKSLLEALVKAITALIVIFIVGRTLLRPMLHTIASANTAKSNELFIATTLLICLGAAASTQYMGLSTALGAFVAGLLVAETEFHVQAEESIAPFKGLLLGLFFMYVGMKIDPHFVLDKLGIIITISIALICIKAIVIISLCFIFDFSLGVSIHSGLILCQGSEFAFILFGLAKDNGIMDDEISQILMLVVTVTMAVTPVLGTIGGAIAEKLDEKKKKVTEEIIRSVADLTNHVIILGFGRVGKMVAMLLEAEKTNYVVIDVDAERVAEKKKEGYPIFLGDGSNPENLKAVGIDRASSVIVAMENKVTAKKVAKVISNMYPDMPIIIRSEDLSDAESYYESGANIIVPETYEAGLQLGGAVLKSIGINEFEISRIKNQFRANNYLKLPSALDQEESNENKT